MRRVLCTCGLLLALFAAGCGDNAPFRPAGTNECHDVRPQPPAGCTGIDQYLHTAGLFDTDGSALGLAVVPEDVAPDVLNPELYVADGENGVLVVDACDPARMSVVSRVAYNGSANDVAVAGRYLYAAWGRSGLVVIDARDPGNPSIVGAAEGPGSALRVAVTKNPRRAYVADDVVGLMIYDVSDPAAPSVLGVENTPGQARDVCVQGPVAYVADAELGLRVVSVESPDNPWLIRAVATPGRAAGVALWNGYAFVADGAAGMTVIDVSDPTEAAVVGGIDTRDAATDVVVEDDVAYVAGGREGLLLYSLRYPETPTLIAEHAADASSGAVAVTRGYAFLADGIAGLRAVDVRNPEQARALDDLGAYAPLDFVAVESDGSRLYVADPDYGLGIVDWRDGAIVHAGGASLGAPKNVMVQDSVAYVSTGYLGVRMLDVRDALRPVDLGTIPGSGSAVDVAVLDSVSITVRSGFLSPTLYDLRGGSPAVSVPLSGIVVRAVDVGRTYAYLVAVQGRLVVVDPDPGAVNAAVWSGDTRGHPVDVCMHEDEYGVERLYVACQTGGTDPDTGLEFGAGIEIYDLSDPAVPIRKRYVETSAAALRVTLQGHLLYVAEYSVAANGLEVFDVSDPLTPVPVGSYWTAEKVNDVAPLPGAIALAVGTKGLIILPPVCGGR